MTRRSEDLSSRAVPSPAESSERVSSVRPNKRRFTFGLFLLTGALPWGNDFEKWTKSRAIPHIGKGEWPLCCGHVLRSAEVEAWKVAGLLEDGPEDDFGRKTVVAGPNLELWLAKAWDGLRVHSWGSIDE